jgi:hypothetical protein
VEVVVAEVKGTEILAVVEVVVQGAVGVSRSPQHFLQKGWS